MRLESLSRKPEFSLQRELHRRAHLSRIWKGAGRLVAPLEQEAGLTNLYLFWTIIRKMDSRRLSNSCETSLPNTFPRRSGVFAPMSVWKN